MWFDRLVRWLLPRNILVAWVLTIPISALVAALTYGVVRLPLGD
jgi:phosphate/sulfate permease